MNRLKGSFFKVNTHQPALCFQNNVSASAEKQTFHLAIAATILLFATRTISSFLNLQKLKTNSCSGRFFLFLNYQNHSPQLRAIPRRQVSLNHHVISNNSSI